MNTQHSKKTRWAGRILTAAPVVLVIVDNILKLVRIPMVAEITKKIGYPDHLVVSVGVLGLVSLVTYAVPRTAVLGAIMLTGYLRDRQGSLIEDPLLSGALLPAFVATILRQRLSKGVAL